MALLVFLLCVAAVHADTIFEFIVWASSYSDTAILRAQGRINDRQPSNNLSLLTMPNTNFLLLTINPNGPTQRQNLLDQVTAGKMFVTKTFKTYGISNEQGSWQWMDPPQIIAPFPNEAYKVWGSTW